MSTASQPYGQLDAIVSVDPTFASSAGSPRSGNEELREGVARWIGMSHAARLLGISEKTLRRHVAAGDIAHYSVGLGKTRRKRLFFREQVEAFILARQVAPLPKAPMEIEVIRQRVRERVRKLSNGVGK
jgi:excisionase family DNA binding protein